jgi:hypothetical protein
MRARARTLTKPLSDEEREELEALRREKVKAPGGEPSAAQERAELEHLKRERERARGRK